AKGVECIMGNFAKRDRYFSGPGYKARWRRYEEKQTDVGIGIHLINDAHLNRIDHGFVVSLDTDMLPAFRLFRHQFPAKNITCIAPPARTHHREIQRVVDVRSINSPK
ncbi:MAG: hypothetical protein ACLFV8_09090, partial [Alphaproteobacteria bacterium]